MTRLLVSLFGFPRLERNGKKLEIDRRKAIALVAYLATDRGAHGREELVALLWPELDGRRARAALRRAIYTLREASGDYVLIGDGDELALATEGVWCDVREFVRGTREESSLTTLSRAVDLYRGDFLRGFAVRDADGFDNWLRMEAERLRSLLVEALQRLVLAYAQQEELTSQALEHAQRLLQHEPFHEGAVRWSMELYARQGRSSIALDAFERYRRSLWEHLGIEPPAELLELYEDMRNRNRSRSRRLAPATVGSLISPPPDEIEAFHRSWAGAVESGRWNAVAERIDAAGRAFDVQGRFEEGVTVMSAVLDALPDDDPLSSRLLLRVGTLQASRGRFEEARDALRRGLTNAQRRGEVRETALGFNRLGYVEFARGRRSEAFRCLERASSMFRELYDLDGLGWSLNVLGHLRAEAGSPARARGALDESFELACELGDRQRIASTLNSLGKAALRERKLGAAHGLFERALHLRRGLAHRIGIADSLNNLGDTLAAGGGTDEALAHYRFGLALALEIDAAPLVMEILIGAGDALKHRDEARLSVELLSLARHHEATWWSARRRAASLLSLLESELSPRDFQLALAAGRNLPCESAAARIAD